MPKLDRRATGDYSRINIQAMEYAETLQGLSTATIRDQFGVTKLGLDITKDFSYQEFIDALAKSEVDGTRDEFEADLGKQFSVMLQQAAAAQQAQQQQGQSQPPQASPQGQ